MIPFKKWKMLHEKVDAPITGAPQGQMGQNQMQPQGQMRQGPIEDQDEQPSREEELAYKGVMGSQLAFPLAMLVRVLDQNPRLVNNQNALNLLFDNIARMLGEALAKANNGIANPGMIQRALRWTIANMGVEGTTKNIQQAKTRYGITDDES